MIMNAWLWKLHCLVITVKMKGKLNKNMLGCIIPQHSRIHLRFDCSLGCAVVVETRVLWSREQLGQGRRSPPKVLALVAAGLGNRPGNRDSCGAEEGGVILGLELSMGDGGGCGYIKWCFISKAAIPKGTLTLDSRSLCWSWFVRIVQLNSMNAILISCAASPERRLQELLNPDLWKLCKMKIAQEERGRKRKEERCEKGLQQFSLGRLSLQCCCWVCCHPPVTHRPGGSVVGDAVRHGLEQPWLRAGHRLQLGLISWEVLVSRSC